MKIVNQLQAKEVRYTAVKPMSHPPRLTVSRVTLLRHVLAQDPHRDRVGGAPGKRKRDRELQGLADRGLIRRTSDGFWRVTLTGKAALEHYIAKGWLRRRPSPRAIRS
jgi:hypothetical protein